MGAVRPACIREGYWKALYMNAPRGKDRWELYDLKNDPGELKDLAEEKPDILERLADTGRSTTPRRAC